jgi:eukaryotic-like serine/threonine-protein kinase
MDGSASSSAEGRSIRPSERIDEACDRFEAAWREGSAPRIEGYLAEALEVDRPALLGELVALERELRRHRGEWPETEEYLERFAGDASVVAAVLQETLTTIESQADRIAMAMSGDAGCNSTGGGRRLPAVLSATAVYRPQRHHARGGLGEVLVAYQEELDRAVALKRVRPDKLHEEARRRFYREAAITARLQHPGIVPIYGLGQDEDGPFYTMPLIEGQTLQQAIDAFHGEESSGRDPGRRALRFRGLLQQLVAVCNTMAYVHDQGVIHRDLKPSNIMLGRYGETLVMDWGLAKRIGTNDARGDAEGEAPSPSPSPDDLTATGAVLGTPQYMSPEQVRGEPTSPASDVFSLGLILYAILTGKSPYADAVLRGGHLREAVVVPPRRREPGLSAALEAICLKALAARSENRYSSPRDLADDLSKWLADESVGAYRDPFADRARRWMKRHRTAVTGGAIALLAVVIGLGAVTGIQAGHNRDLEQANGAIKREKKTADRALDESEAARRRAEAVLAFLTDDVLSATRPEGQGGGLGKDVTVRKAIDAAEPKVAEAFKDQPIIEAAIRFTLGLTYHLLGEPPLAIRQQERALELRRMHLGSDHPDTLRSCHILAAAYFDAGRVAEAVELDRATLERRRATLGPYHLDTLQSCNQLASVYVDVGRITEAIDLLRPTLEECRAKFGPDHPDTLLSGNLLAAAYRFAGRVVEAIDLGWATLERRQATLGLDHPDTLQSRNNLAAAYVAAGRVTEAVDLLRDTLKRREAKFGPDHALTLQSRGNLAEAYRVAGRVAEVVELHRATLERWQAALGPVHPDTLRSRTQFAAACVDANRITEAIDLLRPTLEQYRAKFGPDHPDMLLSCHLLAVAYRIAGRLAEAIELDLATLGRRRATLGPDHSDTLQSRNNLAVDYLEAGRATEAIELLRSTLERRQATLGPDHILTLQSRGNFAAAYRVAGRIDEAIKLLVPTLELMETRLGPVHNYTFNTRSSLAEVYESRGRWADAEPLRRRTVDYRRNAVTPSGLLADGLALLGRDLLNQEKWSDAEPVLRECLNLREKAVPDAWLRFNTMSQLGGALLGRGRYAEAEPLVVSGYQGMKAREAKIPAVGEARLFEAALRVVRLYEGWGIAAQAKAWKERLGLVDLPADVFAQP